MPLSRVAALRALVHEPCMPGLVFLPVSCTNAACPKIPPDAQKASSVKCSKGYVLYRCTKVQRGIPWRGFCRESHLAAE